jgi:DNA mismatch endonuclease (patch repair protein)
MIRHVTTPLGSATTFGGLSRSELMSSIPKYGNKTTEITMARLLLANKLTGWRRHMDLPGKPDFAWPTERVALFVHGCFWHGHACGRNLEPKVNGRWWREKITANKARDRRVRRKLQEKGWKVLTIWECQLRRRPKACCKRVIEGVRCNLHK